MRKHMTPTQADNTVTWSLVRMFAFAAVIPASPTASVIALAVVGMTLSITTLDRGVENL